MAVFRDKKSTRKNFILSIVAILEIIAIMVVATYAWVETVSSIKITDNGVLRKIDTFTYTEADVGSAQGDIDLAKYFKKAGDVHFSPASSSNGRDLFFPIPNKSGTTSKTGTVSQTFRKSTVDDKNVNYLSVTFRVRTTSKKNLDFYFVQAPTITGVTAGTVRFSITAQTEGESASTTKIYALSASNNTVVNSATGGTGTAAVEAISDHLPSGGSTASLFSLKTEETKIVTVNVWIQGTDNSTGTASNINISNFQITTSNTPRHVTLIPTSLWNTNNPSFYAYMWTGSQNEWYDMTDNGDGSYSFDYDGTYETLTFVRSRNGAGHTWGDGYWNQTVDLTIPSSPVNPTFFVTGQSSTVMDGKNNGKYTGIWQDPATIKFNYVSDAAVSNITDMGTVKLIWSGTTITATGGDEDAQIRVRGGQNVTMKATAKVGYEFVGWYDNAEGTGTPVSTEATWTNAAPTSGNTASYYAKFVKVYAVTLKMYIDGTNASGAGTMKMTVNGTDYTSTSASFTENFPEGTVVTFSATVANGYTLNGIYTTPKSGTTTVSSVTVGTSPVENYVRYTAKSYNVKAHSYYSTNGGSTYTADNSTGGTVKVGSSSAGATSNASVKYKNTVTLVASAKDGYQFDGWYNAASGGTRLSSNTSYSYTLNSTNDVNVYARFIGETWSLKYGVHGASNWNSKNMTVSGNTVTGTMTLTEGQDFSFQIVKTVGSTDTWYGGESSYQDITSTSFISNKTLSVDGGDIYMKGHAGTYTFSFNKSTNVLNVTVSYSNITITFDYSAEAWWGNDNAVVSFYDGSGENNMSNIANQTKKTLSISSSRGNSGSVGFNRWNNSSHSTFWNNVDAGTRGYSTTYKMGSGWQ